MTGMIPYGTHKSGRVLEGRRESGYEKILGGQSLKAGNMQPFCWQLGPKTEWARRGTVEKLCLLSQEREREEKQRSQKKGARKGRTER